MRCGLSLSLSLKQENKRSAEPTAFHKAVDAAKRRLLEEKIAECGGNMKLAREAFGLSEATFWRMRRKYGLDASGRPKAEA